jgi:cytidine deaminase
VQKIIGRRVNVVGGKKQLEYRVLWAGFSEADATWEPLTNCGGCLELINEYECQREEIEKQSRKQTKDLTRSPSSPSRKKRRTSK